MIQAYAAGAAALILTAGAATAGWKAANYRRDSQELAIARAAEKAGDAATTAAVSAIQGLQPKYTTINRAVEREITTNTVYGDCKHSDAAWLQIRSAYEAAGGNWGDAGGVPAPATPAR